MVKKLALKCLCPALSIQRTIEATVLLLKTESTFCLPKLNLPLISFLEASLIVVAIFESGWAELQNFY